MKTNLFGRCIAGGLMISAAILFTACSKNDDSTSTMRSYAISGNATGNQVVPSVTGSGTGSMTGTYDPNNRMLTYTTNWSGLTGAPTSGGFYSGASGTNGAYTGTPWTFDSTATGTGTQSGSMMLTQDQAMQLTNGNWYYSYGTAANPGGEVRGQMTAVQQ